MTINQAIAHYASTEGSLQRAHAWKTWCKQWSNEIGETHLVSVDATQINTVVVSMRKRGLAEATIASRINTLKQVFRVARQVPGMQHVRFPEDIARIKERTQRVRDLTPAEELSLRRAMLPRDWEIVELAILTGLRSAELFGLQRKDVNFVSGFLTVRGDGGAKGGYTGRVPINNPKTRRILKAMLDRSTNAYVVNPKGFENWKSRAAIANRWKDKVFRPALRAAGIDDYRFHDNRHACASRLVQKNHSLYVVQHFLRHRTPNQTARYAHLNDDALKKAALSL